jgi:hypothetical protein
MYMQLNSLFDVQYDLMTHKELVWNCLGPKPVDFHRLSKAERKAILKAQRMEREAAERAAMTPAPATPEPGPC